MIGPKEFECLDCGARVYRVIDHAANDHDICAECEWLRGIADPVVREQARRILQGENEAAPIPGDQPTLQLCETCGSEGRLYRGHPNDPDPVDDGACPVCGGTGGELIATQPVSEPEIMEP